MSDRPGRKERGGPKGRNLLWPLIIVSTLVLLVSLGSDAMRDGDPLRPHDFLRLLEEGRVKKVVFQEGSGQADVTIQGLKLNEGEIHRKVNLWREKIKDYIDRIEELKSREVDPIDTQYRVEVPSPFLPVLYTLVPWILVIGVLWFLLFRQMRTPGGGGGVLSFGKSRARLATKENTKVTFADVAGIDEAKEEVHEIIEFLKNPQKFQRIGGRIPRGVLLVGPPGAGKTLLAKAIAGEADVPFFSICGSDFVEMFVGVGASRVRDLFHQAQENSPCIIFLDEVDAVGRRRGSGLGGGHDEREQTLNAILVEMDGFDSKDEIIVMAATNRPDVLDPALLRPGRFDRQISIDLPDLKGREDILRVHARNVKLAPDVDLPQVARGTPMFSGAELSALINEAALRAGIEDRESVTLADLEEARDKVKWGRQKKSRVIEEQDRRITAIHETGHALVAHHIPEAEPIHKVTIIPRGMAGGATMFLPERDRYHTQRRQVLAYIAVAFGGRVAEEIFCNDISGGARDDIKHASKLARLMVTEWGMSERVGPVNYSASEEHLFLGREITRTQDHSEQISLVIDEEVRRIIDECYQRAREIVAAHRDEAGRMAEALLRHETLSGAEVEAVIRGEDVQAMRERPGAAPAPARRVARPSGAVERASGSETRVQGIGAADLPPQPEPGPA